MYNQHITVKQQNIEDKYRIFKATREGREIIFKLETIKTDS